MKRLKAEDYTKWLRRDLWTLQQALFLLLGVEPPDVISIPMAQHIAITRAMNQGIQRLPSLTRNILNSPTTPFR